MKFGEAFTQYLHHEKEKDESLANCSHIEYKRLKKVLKNCRVCRRSLPKEEAAMTNSPPPPQSAGDPYCDPRSDEEEEKECESCPLCDEMFFSELEKEASEISSYLCWRVKYLVDHHVPSKLQKRMMSFLQLCIKDDMPDMARKGRFLVEYVAMNATALRKILKKYDKVHGSVNGRKFKSMLQTQHIELLQSPWLMELGAFCINSSCLNDEHSGVYDHKFSCELTDNRSVMELTLSDSVKLEYNLTCAVCLDILFNPYALVCGHVFCKGCLCSSASVLLFQGVKAASSSSKCPVCRESGVYANAAHMVELNMLVKNRCIEYWKERLQEERIEYLKQSKEFYDLQTKYALGFGP